ncbi:unnamed protein product [Thlaspi arvense]|uniref:Defensin-like domain-containing protein n=1 Tax=Thlaspi arvense TaxID=13288 RepID=A0AAU9S8K4_THLAR|nr:unnamed protein product [Thlaspi arvense]
MKMTKVFVNFVLIVVLAVSLFSSEVFASPAINILGYDYCIDTCSKALIEPQCKDKCLSKQQYSDGACIGSGKVLQCCCKK